MKTLLFILVVGNLLLLGLAFTPDPDAPRELAPPPLPPGVKTLQLLSERAQPTEAVEEDSEQESPAPEQAAAPAQGNEPETAAAAAEPVEVVEAPPPPPVCHTIGPFAQEQDATALSEQLKALGAITAMRQSEIREPAGYWVYLPAMKRQKAKEIIDDLVRNNIEDYFLGAQNYISLGIYSNQEIAQERLEEISDLGYQPKLEQRFKVRDVYWLDAEEPEPLLDEAKWAEMLAGSPGVRRQNLACE